MNRYYSRQMHANCAEIPDIKDPAMTTNITLRMDEALLRSLRHVAVDHNLSVSAWITQVLKKNADQQQSLQQQKKNVWSVTEKTFHLSGNAFDRNACYDRIH